MRAAQNHRHGREDAEDSAMSNLRAIIESFTCPAPGCESTGSQLNTSPAKRQRSIILRGVPSTSSTISKKRNKSQPLDSIYRDLAPSLAPHLTVVFVGFNPGIESSISQHHYAHFSNLFWKLFNQSLLALSVIPTAARDKFVTDGLKVGFAPRNDIELARYGIGFTDLVLRCTKLASELTAAEKLSNVPRLLGELRLAQPRFVVFIGKGVWETVVRYLCGAAPASVLSEFTWGHQTMLGSLTRYKQVLEQLCTLLEYDFEVYVFPSTSGLVTTLNFAQKLELWEHLAKDIYKKRLLSEATSGQSPTHGCKNFEDAADAQPIQAD